MARHKDQNWNLPDGTPQGNGRSTHEWDSIHAAILMDIRDELKALNRVMHCSNVSAGFRALSSINRRMGKFDALKLRKGKP